MNDIVEREFARLTPEPGPPTAITADGLIAGGRARRARRNIATITGATTTVAVVAVAAVLLTVGLSGGTGPDEDRGAADPHYDRVVYDLPELDPDKQYEYSSYDEVTETKITKWYTKDLWKVMEKSFGDLSIVVPDGEKTKTVALTEKNRPRFVRQEEALVEIPCADDGCRPDPEAESLLDRPTYQLMMKDGDSWSTDPQLVFSDRDFPETLNFGFYPAGSFVFDPYDTAKQPWFSGHKHDPYLVDGCSDLDYDGDGTKLHRRYECETDENPGGSDFRVMTVERTMTRDDAPGNVAYRYTVIVIGELGDAIRVTLDSPGHAACDGCGSPGDEPPSMTLKQLTKLAQLMPPLQLK